MRFISAKGLMGCNNTKAKNGDFSGSSNRSDGCIAEEFATLAKQNPVAATLLEEWNKFVYSISGASAIIRKEVWADCTNKGLTHRSVDTVGKLFLVYIRNDLTSRGWGGNFDYSVVGVSNQGYLKANATVDSSNSSSRSRESSWEVKVHYLTTAKPSQ
ncbi:uncharacterized protein TM35_000025440 [Trypanosoma theileri]|uniref:Uncharacterized protein n=1 Tax=Trypanosoma theileri TaxID=67003 RepID=A0A1X0P8L8_9TRYP|nr:uncharacterized protein TM35_000025440 [Trypanosoma theileri]ORC93218.1 hypothetical protein TM35_000025440 [Trypanosoma theileri]